MISSKQLALVLLLLSVSLGAVAQAIAASGIPVDEITYNGMKLMHLIVGTAAAVVSLWFLPRFETKSLGATITCGMFCALLFTPLAMWGYAVYFSTEVKAVKVPVVVENVLAATFGIGGVYIIPGITWAWKSVRDNPWGFFAWIRSGGRTPPPGPPPSGDISSADKGGQS